MGAQESKTKHEEHLAPYGYGYGFNSYYTNPLPIPPKEPLPQAPQTPHGLPRHLQEAHHKPQKQKKNSILRSFTIGSSKPKQENIMNGKHRKHRSDSAAAIANGISAWTYPDGTPFPSMRPELSPGLRPKHGRSASFTGTASKKPKQQRMMSYDDYWVEERRRRDQPQPAWRTRLGIPPDFLRRQHTDVHADDDDDDEHHQVPMWAGAHQYEQMPQQRGRKRRSSANKYFNSNSGMNWMPKGVSNAGYVPPTAAQRNWTYPDGSPFPNLGNVAAGGAGVMPGPAQVQATTAQQQVPITDLGAAAASAAGDANDDDGPVFPSAFPVNGGIPAVVQDNQQPIIGRVPSPIPGTSSSTHPTFAHNPMPAPPQMFSQTPAASVSGNIPPSPQNPSRTFAFDRKSPLSHVDYHAISYKGKIWPTAYHLWEAMKFFDRRPDIARKIRKCPKVRDVKALLAEQGLDNIQTDSEQVLLQRMEEVLFLKFTQHLDILEMLLNTGDLRFLFFSRREPYWGCSPTDFSGGNQMGLCLERVRERLKMEGGEDMVRRWQMRQGPGPIMPSTII